MNNLRSLMGYMKGSPWENALYNIITTKDGTITMSNTNKPLKAFDANTGKFLINMKPGKNYKFNTNKVLEIPIHQQGGMQNGCPPGYIKDETGQCIEDNGFNPSQYQQKGMPIVPVKNESGQMVGGTGAIINTPSFARPKKGGFGSISMFDTLGALNYGFGAIANTIEENRQRDWIRKQMSGNFNGTFSNAQNDYGVDPYEQTGQLRAQFQQGGFNNMMSKMKNTTINNYGIQQSIDPFFNIDQQFDQSQFSNIYGDTRKGQRIMRRDMKRGNLPISVMDINSGQIGYSQSNNFIPNSIFPSSQQFEKGGNFNVYDFLYGDDDNKSNQKSEEKSLSIKKQNIRITEDDIDELSSLGLSPEDILNSPNSWKSRNNRNTQFYNISTNNLFEGIAKGESNGNYFAANPQPGQTAFGKYQFTNDAQKDAYNASGGKGKYGSFENYQKLFKTIPQIQEEAMSLRMNQAKKVVGDNPVALALYHYAPKFGIMYSKGQLDLDKTPASYGIGKGVKNPSFRNFLNTHGFKEKFKIGGVFELDDNEIDRLTKMGYKIKRLTN